MPPKAMGINPHWSAHRQRFARCELDAAANDAVNGLVHWLGTLEFEFGRQPRSVSLARIYLRRFFATPAAREADARLAALACVFLASKVDELRWPRSMHGSLQKRGLRLHDVCRFRPDTTAEAVAQMELSVLQAIGFYLAVTEDDLLLLRGDGDAV